MPKKESIILLIVCVLFGGIVKFGILGRDSSETSEKTSAKASVEASAETSAETSVETSKETEYQQESPESIPSEPIAAEAVDEMASDILAGDFDNYLILPDSGNRYLTEDDLIGLDQDMLRLAKNEVYAKHGRKFQTVDLDQYFSAQPWYRGSLSEEEFDDSVFNEYEKANLDLLISYGDSLAAGSGETQALGDVDWYSRYDDVLSQEQNIRAASLQTEPEKLSLEVYSLWDQFLNDLYGHIKSSFSEEAFEEVKIAQREWIETRDSYAERAAVGYDGSDYDAKYYAAMTEMTKARIHNLMNYYLP